MIKKPPKVKTKADCELNFSDRTLSSKLYSIKRKEIFLCNKDKSLTKKDLELSARSNKPLKRKSL